MRCYALLFLVAISGAALPVGIADDHSDVRFFDDDQINCGSAAVRVPRGYLIHSASVAAPDPSGILKHDFLAALKELNRFSRGGTIVKLHICISPDAFTEETITQFIADQWILGDAPAITIVEASGGAEITLDAVWHSDSSELSNLAPSDGVLSPDCDILHLSGRAASGELTEATSGTMEQLFAVLGGLGADRESVVQIKAFIQPIDQREIVEQTIIESFGDLPVPPIVFVQWTSASRATEIELIAEAPGKTDNTESTSYYIPPGDKPSPVFSRVGRIHGDEVIFIGGIAGTTNKSATVEVSTLYDGLKRVAAAAGTDLRHFAKATYYVSEDGASAALNEQRPGLYDPARPPAASKVQVPGVGISNRGIAIDMVAAPSD